MKATLKVIVSAFILWGLLTQPAIAQDVYKFKIAIDTVMDHPLAQGLLIFMEDIKKKSNDKDCKRSEARLHSGYNCVELSRFAPLWGFNWDCL